MAREAKLKAWAPATGVADPMARLVIRAEREALALLLPELRQDSLASALLSLGAVGDSLRRWLSDRLILDTVTATGERAQRMADDHWAAEVSRAVGRDVVLDRTPSRAVLQGWIANNTARIQGLRNETLERIRSDLETAVLSQVRPQELAAQWERDGLPTRNGRLRGRATLIARDQLGTLASQIAEAQARALGLTEYMWDDRPAVSREQRPIHRGRRGARYKWTGAPPGGHPGREINCECRAVSVVSLDRLPQVIGDPFNHGVPRPIVDPPQAWLG